METFIFISGTATDLANWLMQEVKKSYDDNRAPVTFLADASWFDDVEESLNGMEKFLDELKKMKDVFLVSQWEIVQWMQKPVLTSAFKPHSKKRNLKCDPRNCAYVREGQPRTMVSCVPCPTNYPWIGNPSGN